MQFDYHGIWGTDVSTYQDSPSIPGHINFQKMKDAGASFVILKAGQGNWIDQDFLTGWSNSKGILPRHPYWYYDNLYEPKSQANLLWNVIKDDAQDIMVWLDLEDRLLGQYAGWKKWYDWIQEFKRISGFPEERIGIYTNFYYWIENLRLATLPELNYFSRHPLWLASYPPDPFHPPYEDIFVPPPWTSPLILQSGTPSIGIDLGVESKEIDYNQFNGDEEKFKQYFKPTTGEPTPMTDYTELKPNVDGEYRSIRQQTPYPQTPHIFGLKVGQINPYNLAKALPTDFYEYAQDVSVVIAGTTYQAKAGDKWWKIYEANGTNISGWVAEIHMGRRYLNTTFVPIPSPAPSHIVEVFVDGELVFKKELS